MLVAPTVTADQLLELDEPGTRHELVRGELRRMSPAGHWHGSVALRIGGLLARFVDDHELGFSCPVSELFPTMPGVRG